ncbi:hypothetical protein ES703_125686 [subsurface metagenome]
MPVEQRLPNRVAGSLFRVHGDQTTGEKEGSLTLEPHPPERRLGAHGLRRQRHGLARLRWITEQDLLPLLGRGSARFGHLAALVFLVACPRSSGVVVARCDEAERRMARLTRLVEAPARQDVLYRAARPIREARVEAVGALTAVAPLGELCSR